MLSNLEIIGWEEFWGLPKLDEAVGRVQFGSPRNFFNPIISKLDEHVVLLPINYIESEKRRQARVRESPQAFSLRFAQRATGQTPHLE